MFPQSIEPKVIRFEAEVLLHQRLAVNVEIAVGAMVFANGVVEVDGLGYVYRVSERKIQDFYFHKAKREKFSARSVYKLQNIQDKYHLLAKGNRVLDLGAAPGSWTEYLLPILSPNGELWALDLKPVSAQAQQKNPKIRFEI